MQSEAIKNQIDRVRKLDPSAAEELQSIFEAYESTFKLQQQRIERLLNKIGYPEQEEIKLEEEVLLLRHQVYGKSSEKRPSKKDIQQKSKRGKSPVKQLPSLRYPDAMLVEKEIDFKEAKACSCCGADMKKLPMTENSEYVEVMQKAFHVVRQMRCKYRCPKCHGDIKTAPNIPRIKPGSSYSDDLMIDVAVSKYADHMPIERYRVIAERCGLVGVPPQSLIECTHHLSDFLQPIYDKLRAEVKAAKVLQADETTWRMLEDNDGKASWQLWGFFTDKTS